MRLRLIKGDTFSQTLTIIGNNNLPIDLTGATVKFSIADILTIIQTAHINPTYGITVIEFESADYPALVPANYDYDVEVTLANNQITTYGVFKIEVIQDITK